MQKTYGGSHVCFIQTTVTALLASTMMAYAKETAKFPANYPCMSLNPYRVRIFAQTQLSTYDKSEESSGNTAPSVETKE